MLDSNAIEHYRDLKINKIQINPEQIYDFIL